MDKKEAGEILSTLSCYGLSMKLTKENIDAIDIILDSYEEQQNRINYLEDLIWALETYYSITVEDLENCMKKDK